MPQREVARRNNNMSQTIYKPFEPADIPMEDILLSRADENRLIAPISGPTM